MGRTTRILIAVIGVFFGSLLSDYLFGGVIENDDIQQAISMAAFIGIIQVWLTRNTSR